MNLSNAMTQWPARQFYLLLGGGALLVLAGFASTVTVPQAKRFSAAQLASRTLPEPVDTSDDLALELAAQDTRIVDLMTSLHGDRANLAARELEAFVIDKLQTAAWTHNVTLVGVTPKSGDTVAQFREVVFNLSLTGDYRDLFGWLHGLRNELGFVVIKELRLARDSEDGDSLRADVTLASYQREDAL